ncbi:acetylserotonin O-methyltransferase 1-like [Oryza brachyantha]|uniref:O-methyltransferase domain-containing protein n=1 Tax=Oryza brachyantha TaxID=4533 RepID=J3MFC3_ORYBR|nr:acetylserotonin O-methyltransferase 1-like [Oryza brachyantha]
MALKLLAEVSPQELLVALGVFHHHALAYVKSTALKCAVDLGIPDAIHRRGGAATLADVTADAAVHPAKVSDLRRLMDLLSTTGIFTSSTGAGGDDGEGTVVYGLTTAGRFVVGSHNLSPMVQFLVDPLVVSSFFSMPDWFRSEPPAAAAAGAGGGTSSLFEAAHGCSQWEMAGRNSALNSVINSSMVADSYVFIQIVLADKRHVFSGLSSVVDVGGGHGVIMQVIAREFPHIKCSVLDLPHVVGQAPAGDGKVQYIPGNMFESIPPADAVVLKSILHDWSDDDCVKILERCKEAIPERKAGGKVIIMEMVRGSGPQASKIKEMEAIQNMFMMYINGKERDENELKKIFTAAGFSEDYKIMPVVGPFSLIEIYPCMNE